MKSKYTVIPDKILTDIHEVQTLGLIVILLSGKYDDIEKERLSSTLGMSKTAFTKSWKQLTDLGYIVESNEGYQVFDTPDPLYNHTNSTQDLFNEEQPTEQIAIVKDNSQNDLKEESFNRFWDLYGKKGTRKKALSKWMKLSKPQIDKCFELVGPYILSTPDRQYRKGCESWLHNECWNDEVDLPKVDKRTESLGKGYNHIMDQVRKAEES